MFKFHIQLDGEISPSVQLYNQIRLAIASNQFPPGYRLPSTRQLAMITGLHRNTINKVYHQLEESGLVESLAGSGFYVKSLTNQQKKQRQNIIFPENEQIYKLVQTSVDQLLNKGVTLNEVRELFLAEIDWRWHCSAKVIVTAPIQDLGIGELMLGELNTALNLPIELIALENLDKLLDDNLSATIITNRYFVAEVEAITKNKLARIIPIDIYDYSQEMNIIKNLSPGSCAGIISISSGILRAAEVISHSIRGDEILILTAQINDQKKLTSLLRQADIIITEPAIYARVKAAIKTVRDNLIRIPKLICSQNYIGLESINILKRELGL